MLTNKLLLAFLCVAVVLFFVFINNFQIFLLRTLPETSSEVGYLYTLQDKDMGYKFKVVTDVLVPQEIWNQEEFLIQLEDKSHLWNPKVCAQMPSLILKNGDIHMIETVFDTENFSKKYIIYNSLTKTKKYFDLSTFGIDIKVFDQNSGLGFQVKRGGIRYVYDPKFIINGLSGFMVWQISKLPTETDSLLKNGESGELVVSMLDMGKLQDGVFESRTGVTIKGQPKDFFNQKTDISWLALGVF